MNILILGSGGREHAFAWKFSQSPMCKRLFVAPGNAGTGTMALNVDIAVTDFEKLKDFCLKEDINFIFVGPEVPLVMGIYDFFQKDPFTKHIMVLGPEAKAATLEGSKAFAKDFMKDFNIPTAAYQSFSTDTLTDGYAFIDEQNPPIVLKADGLAAGKGVLIIEDKEEAKSSLKEMLEGKFGPASQTVVIEEFLAGIEFSVFALTDGKSYKILPIAKDYKRIGEGDSGLNTGGMGAISPPPFVTEEIMEEVLEKIVKPTIDGLHSRSYAYHGFVFFGLVLTAQGVKVIEYNCRMGDPETEAVLPRIKSDLFAHCLAAANGKLEEETVVIDFQSAATVMLVSGGYPEAYEKGKQIKGHDQISDSLVFHAGTIMNENELVTNGGRVIAITSLANEFTEAIKQSLENAEKIDFEAKYFRTDIGFDLV